MIKTEKSIWAITTPEGEVVWSVGGGSTKRRLMVYASESSAKRAVVQIKQWFDRHNLEIHEIYNNQPTQ
jgi:hypothetical protein